jgi:ATP-binding cassette subfamily C protein CydCD
VSFSSVSFEYEHGIPVLRNVSLELAPGKTTALVGPSGSGKTTLAHLLMRFWDPTSGAIFLNGHDLRDYTLDQLRAHIALVAQETYLFNASVRENLLLARPSASEGDLMEAVSRAGLGELLEMLPEGLDTIVGERGGLLSGGQRQRVAIGRAFLKNAPILILDEATSHLDTQNEALVRVALDDLKSDRTTLVIAHRLSTIREADEIVAIDRGRIVERGSHEALVARSGFYTDLVRAQIEPARVQATTSSGPAAVPHKRSISVFNSSSTNS